MESNKNLRKFSGTVIINNHNAMIHCIKRLLAKDETIKIYSLEITNKMHVIVSNDSIRSSRIIQTNRLNKNTETVILGDRNPFEKTYENFSREVINLKISNEAFVNINGYNAIDIFTNGLDVLFADNTIRIFVTNTKGSLYDIQNMAKAVLTDEERNQLKKYYIIAVSNSGSKSNSYQLINKTRKEIDELYNREKQVDLLKNKLANTNNSEEQKKILSKNYMYLGMQNSHSLQLCHCDSIALVGSGKDKEFKLGAFLVETIDKIGTEKTYSLYNNGKIEELTKYLESDEKILSEELDGIILGNADALQEALKSDGISMQIDNLLVQAKPFSGKGQVIFLKKELYEIIARKLQEKFGLKIVGKNNNHWLIADSNSVKMEADLNQGFALEIMSVAKESPAITGSQMLSKFFHFCNNKPEAMNNFMNLMKNAYEEELNKNIDEVLDFSNKVSPLMLKNANKFSDNYTRNDSIYCLKYGQRVLSDKLEQAADANLDIISKLHISCGFVNLVIQPDFFEILGIRTIPENRIFVPGAGNRKKCITVKMPTQGPREIGKVTTITVDEIKKNLKDKNCEPRLVKEIINYYRSLKGAAVVNNSAYSRAKEAGRDHDWDKFQVNVYKENPKNSAEKLGNFLVELGHDFEEVAVMAKQKTGLPKVSFTYDKNSDLGLIGQMGVLYALKTKQSLSGANLGSLINAGMFHTLISMENDEKLLISLFKSFRNQVLRNSKSTELPIELPIISKEYQPLKGIKYRGREVFIMDNNADNHLLNSLRYMEISLYNIRAYLNDSINIHRYYGEGCIDSDKHMYTMQYQIFQNAISYVSKMELENNKGVISRKNDLTEEEKGKRYKVTMEEINGNKQIKSLKYYDKIAMFQDKLIEYHNKLIKNKIEEVEAANQNTLVIEDDKAIRCLSSLTSQFGSTWNKLIDGNQRLTEARYSKEGIRISREEYKNLVIKNKRKFNQRMDLLNNLIKIIGSEDSIRTAEATSLLGRVSTSNYSNKIVEKEKANSIHQYIGGNFLLLDCFMNNPNMDCSYTLIPAMDEVKVIDGVKVEYRHCIPDGTVVSVEKGIAYWNDRVIGFVQDSYNGNLVVKNTEDGKVKLTVDLLEYFIKKIKDESKEVDSILLGEFYKVNNPMDSKEVTIAKASAKTLADLKELLEKELIFIKSNGSIINLYTEDEILISSKDIFCEEYARQLNGIVAEVEEVDFGYGASFVLTNIMRDEKSSSNDDLIVSYEEWLELHKEIKEEDISSNVNPFDDIEIEDYEDDSDIFA